MKKENLERLIAESCNLLEKLIGRADLEEQKSINALLNELKYSDYLDSEMDNYLDSEMDNYDSKMKECIIELKAVIQYDSDKMDEEDVFSSAVICFRQEDKYGVESFIPGSNEINVIDYI